MWKIDAVLGMLFTFLLAYGLDRWIQSLREIGFRTNNMTTKLWVASLANLLVGVALVILAEFVLFSRRRSKVISIIYFLTGLILTFMPIALALTPKSFSFLWSPPYRNLRITLIYSSTNSRLIFTSATIAIIGIYGLLPRRGRLFNQVLGRFW